MAWRSPKESKKTQSQSDEIHELYISVVTQEYVTDTHNVYVIKGNSALVKCEIPSFVADFVAVESWSDSMDNQYFSQQNHGITRSTSSDASLRHPLPL